MSAADSTIPTPLGVVLDRLLRYVRINDESGCWEWHGTQDSNGYGVASLWGKKQYLHRLTYELCVEPIPEGKFVCHHCDNPRCCNPEHVFLGTQTDNMADKVAKGRQARWDRHGSAKLTPKMVLEIRVKREAGRKLQEIADEYGVSMWAIWRVVTGKSWKGVVAS